MHIRVLNYVVRVYTKVDIIIVNSFRERKGARPISGLRVSLLLLLNNTQQNRNKRSTSDIYEAHKHIQNTLYVYFVILLYSAAAYCTLICGLISQSVFGFIYVYIQLYRV